MPSQITSKQWLTLLCVQLCTILFGVTVTSVAVILPQIKGALSATQDQVAWILTLNLVATAAATPLTGWLASKLGWRRLMIGSVLGFTGASVACGTATSLETLLVFRVIQGALGAPIFPMGQAIILAKFERRLHPMAIMMWGVGGVMGPILGPTFGGLVADTLDWRWSFFMILPLGLAACVPTVLALGDEERGTARRFDFVGFVFIAVAIGSLQLMFDRGQRLDWFESPEIIVESALAAGCLYLFFAHAGTSRAPLFEAATLQDRNFVLGVGFALVMGMLQFTPMVLFPPLLQDLRGYPESIVGYLIAMRGVGNFLSFLVVAPLTRWNPQATLAAGLLIQAGAAAWMGVLDMNMTFEQVLWTNLLHGFGFGLAYTPMTVLAFSTLEPRLLTQGNAIFSLLRMLGSSLFIAVTLVVFVRSAAEAHASLVTFITLFDARSLSLWIQRFGDLGTPLLHARLVEEIRRQAAMIGYINAFNLLAIVPALIAPAVLFFRLKR
ncbi:DHA2 family efflux MFS transporter permease subunit [Thalassobaculum sp. OXR-137]|uniref:DHA2 family efflux MFS transporter permease subunit n=1 Tax=Thalassobaculum sp. OXR-137 TaxID=3100173 RepID=UPI002AC8D5C6|nr:DHA2 family efflux MFS transporter permease subunit [Thalassobaculum sp. OXR-137]WPZ32734.1 DHA2 family efflux MFS transporter permease subunit [Thalassobaculum sp. OXR-137]